MDLWTLRFITEVLLIWRKIQKQREKATKKASHYETIESLALLQGSTSDVSDKYKVYNVH